MVDGAMIGYRRMILLLILALMSTAANAQDKQISADLPDDVTTFIRRRGDCLDPKSPESWRVTFKCEAVSSDEKDLRQKYEQDARIISALNATWTKVVQRVPVRVLVPENAPR
jgi:hypothetical protein